MIQAFRRVSLRHLSGHKLRTIFTVGGIALGVAVVVAIELLHGSVASSYQRMVERIAGKAVLQVTNGEVGVPEELLKEIQAIPGVSAAVASVQGFVSVPRLPGERLYLFGIDLLADQELRDYQHGSSEAAVEDPLVFLAQPNSIAVTTTFLERSGLALDDSLGVLSPAGTIELRIRASLDIHTGPASLFGGRLAVMDVFAAQRLFDLDRRFSQIDAGLALGFDLETVEREVQKVVGARGLVERPQARGETLEKLLTSNRYGMMLAAMLAVVVGLYLIFNTMMVAVAQRRREIGCLRALGVRRREVLRLVLLEAALLGAVGCLVGVPLGYGMAGGMSQAFALNLSAMYMPIDAPEIRLDAASIVWGVSLGLGAAIVAAAVPAREAVKIHALEALRPTIARSRGVEPYRRAALLGGTVTTGALLVWVTRAMLPVSKNASGSGAILGLLVGVSLAVPIVVRTFALRAEPLLARLLGPVGGLASRSIVDHIGRVAITCSAFLVSLAGAIAIATLLSSFQHTLRVWIDGLFANIDLVIASGAKPLANDATPLPGSLADQIARLPGVAWVDMVRIVKVMHEGSLTTLIATDASLRTRGLRTIEFLEGDRAAADRALERGDGVAVNEAFALRYGKRTGDAITLTTPSGELRRPIVGIYFDPAYADLGIVTLDRRLYRENWRDDTVNFLEPALEPGADRVAMIDTIRRRWGDEHALFIMTMEQFRGEVEELLAQSMLVTYPLVGIAIAIALLGVVNSLLASVLDRIREIGVLRAIGATRGQIARSIVLEATIIGLIGGLLAAAVGSALGYVQVDVIFHGMFGMTVLYRYPTASVVFSVVAAALLAAAAGYLPGRSAGRLKIVEALEYE